MSGKPSGQGGSSEDDDFAKVAVGSGNTAGLAPSPT